MPEEQAEVMLAAIDSIYSWHAKRAGVTLFGSHLGRLLLTNRRLLFLSTGTSGMARALVYQLLGNLPALVWGVTRTDELDLSTLTNEGSLNLVLERIVRCQVKRRVDLSSYLSVDIHAAGGTRPVSFMTRLGFARKTFLEFRDALEKARLGHRVSGERPAAAQPD
jgi:hypothetical protein